MMILQPYRQLRQLGRGGMKTLVGKIGQILNGCDRVGLGASKRLVGGRDSHRLKLKIDDNRLAGLFRFTG